MPYWCLKKFVFERMAHVSEADLWGARGTSNYWGHRGLQWGFRIPQMEAFLVILKRTPIWTIIGPYSKKGISWQVTSAEVVCLLRGASRRGGRWQPPEKLHLQGARAAVKPRSSAQHPGCAAGRPELQSREGWGVCVTHAALRWDLPRPSRARRSQSRGRDGSPKAAAREKPVLPSPAHRSARPGVPPGHSLARAAGAPTPQPWSKLCLRHSGLVCTRQLTGVRYFS